MALTSMDGYFSQVGANKTAIRPFSVETTATTATMHTGQVSIYQNMGLISVMDSLPSGVTSFKLVGGRCRASTAGFYTVAKMVDLGNLTLATPMFVDSGNTMPTLTEGNTSRVTSGAMFMETTVAFNATPGSFTVTYVDQDGNTAEASASTALTASVAIGTMAPLVLNSNDVGVRDVTDATRTGGTTPSGTIKFWGVIPLATFSIQSVTQGDIFNLTTSDLPPPNLGAGDSLYLIHTGAVAAKAAYGTLFFVGNT